MIHSKQSSCCQLEVVQGQAWTATHPPLLQGTGRTQKCHAQEQLPLHCECQPIPRHLCVCYYMCYPQVHARGCLAPAAACVVCRQVMCATPHPPDTLAIDGITVWGIAHSLFRSERAAQGGPANLQQGRAAAQQSRSLGAWAGAASILPLAVHCSFTRPATLLPREGMTRPRACEHIQAVPREGQGEGGAPAGCQG